MQNTPMSIEQWQEKRAHAYAEFVGKATSVRKMLADPSWRVDAARAVEYLIDAEQRLTDTFAAIEAEWRASREQAS